MKGRQALNLLFAGAGYITWKVVLLAAITALSSGGMARAQQTEPGPTVQVRSHAELGEILVGPNGMTLYTFVRDEAGISSCMADCAANWPPLVIEREPVAPVGLKGQLGSIRRSRPDFRLQVTYDGQPMYYWSRDQAPGDATGHGVGDVWFVARP